MVHMYVEQRICGVDLTSSVRKPIVQTYAQATSSMLKSHIAVKFIELQNSRLSIS